MFKTLNGKISLKFDFGWRCESGRAGTLQIGWSSREKTLMLSRARQHFGSKKVCARIRNERQQHARISNGTFGRYKNLKEWAGRNHCFLHRAPTQTLQEMHLLVIILFVCAGCQAIQNETALGGDDLEEFAAIQNETLGRDDLEQLAAQEWWASVVEKVSFFFNY